MQEEFNNGLSNAQLERLALLAEEAGEVIQCVSKIIRHGYNSYNPFDTSSGNNKDMLEKELGHLECAIDLLTRKEDLCIVNIMDHCSCKHEKVGKWLHFQ